MQPRTIFRPTLAVFLAAAFLAPAVPPARAGRLKAHHSRYYVIHTNLDARAVQEASARMTAMAEEYHRRTKGFGGVIRSRLSFYLFGDAEAYHKAGGTPGSAGMYIPSDRALMALADDGVDERLWHVVQHEGFHQFAHMVIRGRLPVWINEGMAEYFGHGIWTGDGFVTGVIPPRRLRRVQAMLRSRQLLPFEEMLTMSYEAWSQAVRDSAPDEKGVRGPRGRPAGKDDADRARMNYDQAWSMIHFLVHAENGRYRKALSLHIRDISRGANWKRSWAGRFGRNIDAFQQRYRAWWLALEDNPTEGLYIQAVVETLTSFLARAVSQGQAFDSAEDFLRQARAGELKSHPDQWLPPALLNSVLLKALRWRGAWSLESTARVPRLVLTWGERTYTGTFMHGRGRCAKVNVAVTQKQPG